MMRIMRRAAAEREIVETGILTGVRVIVDSDPIRIPPPPGGMTITHCIFVQGVFRRPWRSILEFEATDAWEPISVFARYGDGKAREMK